MDDSPLPLSDDDAAFFAAIVAAGPAGLPVKAGRLVARADGDFDLILADPAADPGPLTSDDDNFGGPS